MAISQEWWDKWWAADFSWDGLADKTWEGWVVMDDGRVLPMEDAPGDLEEDFIGHLELPDDFPGRQATQQDYWRDQEDHLISSPDGSVRFTPLHLPLAWRDGSPVDPSFRPDETELNTIIKAKLEAAEETSINIIGRVEGTDKRAQFQGVVFPRFSLADLTDRANDLPTTQDEPAGIPLSARFEFAAFSGNASFANAAFSGDASFYNAAFSGDARFDNAAFSGDARFENAAFSGDAWFDNAAFSGYASFNNAAFSGDVWFDNAAFSGAADFENAAFSGGAWFDNAAFSGNAWFENAAFSGRAIFNNAAFSEYALFNNAAFSGYAGFNNAAFSGDARFVNAAFSGNAWFENAAFSGYTEFSNVLFLNGVSFAGQGAELVNPEEVHSLDVSQDERMFKGALKIPQQVTPRARRAFKNGSFENAIFLGDAVITNRDMLDRLSFDSVFFGGAAEFQGSNLHQGVSFFGADFTFVLTSPEGKSFAVHFEDDITHARAAYAAYVFLFRLAHSIQKTDTELVFFQDYMRGWVREMLENAPKPGKDTSKHSSRHAQIERAFRKLKLSMEEVRNKIQEQDFYRKELLARRRRRDDDVSKPERLISDAYKTTSDFGGSIMWPIGWLIGLTIVSWLFVYYPWHTGVVDNVFWERLSPGEGKVIDDDLWRSLSFSLSNIFPFGTFGETRKSFLAELSPGWRLGMGFVATIQSLIAIILVFLSGLAIRRRFQIS